MALPSGTVTFVFTDIEGSSRLWDAHPDAMRVAVARHDDLVRMSIEAHGGIVFKTIGDAFCAAFHTAPDALSAALDAQRSLAREAWPEPVAIKVRMAVHTGAVESRENDYFGQPLNRVARLLSTSYGGQTILSHVTHELVRDNLLPDASLEDLGDHRLTDLARGERVFQLNHPDLPSEFAPLKSLDSLARPNNLPQQVTSFIGREKELAEVRERLATTRLLTLTGAGGGGKSRLSLQAAAELLEQFPDGAFLVELAPLADSTLVATTVAAILGVREIKDKPILATLAAHLKSRRLLLLLDNCEHVLDASAQLVDALLRHCPGVKILATSREALGIGGESIYRIPSLSLPNPKHVQTAQSLSQFEAVQLFIDRALLTQPNFTVTNENAPALASICFRLDGIPLAIELAAARARSLSVDEINVKLDQRFRLLTGGSRTALPRQQTLRSLIDWSFDLLSPAEQALLCRLSVFAGGCVLDAVEAICPGGDVEEWEALDLLTSLCDKSLVVAESSSTTTRYRLLETVRQYARDRLLERGEGETFRDKHLAFYLAVAEEVEPLISGSEMKFALDRMEVEQDNFRAGLEWSRDTREQAESSLRLALAVGRFFQSRGYFVEQQERLSRAMENSGDVPPKLRAKGLFGLGTYATAVLDFATARPLLEESLKIQQELNERQDIGNTLNALGTLATYQEDYASARQYYEESLAIHRETGNQRGIAAALNNLGSNAYYLGNLAEARRAYEESLNINRALGSSFNIYVSLLNQGEIHFAAKDYPAAALAWRESLSIVLEHNLKGSMHWALRYLAALVAVTESSLKAAHIWGMTERLREGKGEPWPIQDQQWLDAQVTAARADLADDDAFDAALQEGRSMTLDEVLKLAWQATSQTRH